MKLDFQCVYWENPWICIKLKSESENYRNPTRPSGEGQYQKVLLPLPWTLAYGLWTSFRELRWIRRGTSWTTYCHLCLKVRGGVVFNKILEDLDSGLSTSRVLCFCHGTDRSHVVGLPSCRGAGHEGDVRRISTGDRCQELVFIGKDLKHRVMQRILDTCLLTDQEMALGERAWQRLMTND